MILEGRALQSRNFLLFNVEISITPLQLIFLIIIIDNIGSGLTYQIYLVFQYIEKERIIHDFLSHHFITSQFLQSNLVFPAILKDVWRLIELLD